jgi:peptide chain release factor subunit 1
MAATVSWETMRDLARFRAEKGCAISFYLDLDPRVTPTAGDLATRANSLLVVGERSNGMNRGDLTHDQRLGLKADFERIGRYIADDFDRDGARGLAIFAAGLDNAWTPLPLTEAVPDEVKVARDFFLAPLVPLVGRGEGALVAVVGRERGQIYRLRAGKLHEIVDRTEEQPRRHDQGGWSQARMQRHVDGLAAEHVREVVEELNRHVRQLHAPPVVVACTEDMRPEVSEELAQETRAALAGWINAEAHVGPAQLLELASPVLESWRGKREIEVLERWREEAGRGGRAVSGWAGTLEAASDGRVDLLLFQEGADHEAWQCPACGRAALRDGNCPLDGTRMERREEGLDLAVHQTLAHGGTVCAVQHRRDLDPVEGVGALLRY